MKRRDWIAGIAAVSLLVAAGSRVAAGRRGAEPAAAVPVIVELFTSEGCSSCPPADELLRDLLSKQPVNGADIIALGEHVDYWNQLGWRDPFSSAAFTARQQRYAETTASGVYTPQMVVDGTSAFVGSDRAEALTQIRAAAARPKAQVTLAWTSPSRLDVVVAHASPHDDVLLAIVEDGLSSAVKSGENAGRIMTHAAVARRLQQIGAADNSGSFHVTCPAQVDASWRHQALRAIVIVQQRGERAIDGAAAVRWSK